MTEIKRAGAILIVLITLLFAFIALSINGVQWLPITKSDLMKVRIANTSLNVEVADSPEEHRKGLSEHNILPKNHGMLFVFKNSAKWQITTRNMKFPIDIFWMDESGRIVDIKKYAPPGSREIYSPGSPAKYILETNADFADIYDIKVGDYVDGI